MSCSNHFSLADMRLNFLQDELMRVLYPVFIHCFMDLVGKGYVQEGVFPAHVIVISSDFRIVSR